MRGKAFSFVKSTTATPPNVAQNNIDTGLGEVPSCIILFCVPLTAAGFGAGRSICMGFSDGTNHYAMSGASQDNVNPSNCNARHALTAITIVGPTGTSPLAEATVSFQTGAGAGLIDFTWTTNDAGAYIIIGLAIAGVSAKVANYKLSGTSGAQAFTGIGFQPDMMFSLCPSSGSAPPANKTNGGPFSFGFYNPSNATSQPTLSNGALDNVTPGDTARSLVTVFNSGLVAATAYKSGAWGNTPDAALTSFDADGFTLSDIVSSVATYFGVLCLKTTGGSRTICDVIRATAPTSTGNQSLTGSKVRPVAALLISGSTITDGTTIYDGAMASIGVTDGVNQFAIWAGDADAKNPSEADCWLSTTRCIGLNAAASPASMEGQASIVSLDATGLTLNWDVAPASAYYYYALLFGNPSLVVPTPAAAQQAILVR